MCVCVCACVWFVYVVLQCCKRKGRTSKTKQNVQRTEREAKQSKTIRTQIQYVISQQTGEKEGRRKNKSSTYIVLQKNKQTKIETNTKTKMAKLKKMAIDFIRVRACTTTLQSSSGHCFPQLYVLCYLLTFSKGHNRKQQRAEQIRHTKQSERDSRQNVQQIPIVKGKREKEHYYFLLLLLES